MELIRRAADAAVDPVLVGLVLLAAGLVLVALRQTLWAGWTLSAAGLLCIYLFSAPAVASALANHLQRRALALTSGASFEGARWVVVLGGGAAARPGRPVTAWLEPASMARFLEGLRVARQLDGSTLVFTGGRPGEAHPVAEVEARAAVEVGFPADRIVTRPHARNTREEMGAVARLVGTGRFVLVTSVQHLPRAVQEARARGLDPVPDAAGPVPGASRHGGWVPSSDALEQSRAALHEIVGGWWYRLTGP